MCVCGEGEKRLLLLLLLLLSLTWHVFSLAPPAAQPVQLSYVRGSLTIGGNSTNQSALLSAIASSSGVSPLQLAITGPGTTGTHRRALGAARDNHAPPVRSLAAA